jgi:deoxyribonuclease V
MLLPGFEHPWNLSPRQAADLQRQLAARVERHDRLGSIETVAGIDVGIVGDTARAAVVVLNLPDLSVIERVRAERPLSFPYVPGLLSFREAPVILDALARLQSRPDLLIVDGQGYAHPRRMGIACHIGILLDHPTIGCAKSRLVGAHQEPDMERGCHTWLCDGEEIIGVVLRTRSRVKPLYISVGHRVSLDTAIAWILRCCTRYRLPEPIRCAHHAASSLDLHG